MLLPKSKNKRIGLAIYGGVLLVAGFFSFNYQAKRREEILTSIEQSNRAVEIMEERLSRRIDKNNDRIIDASELRAALDELGYTRMIGSANKFLVYDPDRPSYPSLLSDIKEYDRSDVHLSGDTIYIPIKTAQQFLLK